MSETHWFYRLSQPTNPLQIYAHILGEVVRKKVWIENHVNINLLRVYNDIMQIQQ